MSEVVVNPAKTRTETVVVEPETVTVTLTKDEAISLAIFLGGISDSGIEGAAERGSYYLSPWGGGKRLKAECPEDFTYKLYSNIVQALRISTNSGYRV